MTCGEGKADSIKNHLANQFNYWRQLMHHAKTVTKTLIDTNMTKHKDMLNYLRRSCDQQPDIDAFTLLVIYKNYIKRLNSKIIQVKEYCKKQNIESALNMS